MQKRGVVILGSTGSIGTSALKVARDIPDRMEIVGLAAGTSVEALARQAREFNVRSVCIFNPSGADELARALPGAQVETGEEGLCRLAQLPEADMVLISIVGTAGLKPALAAIEAGKDLAIASKEILVMAGQIVMEKARRAGVQVLPVDSEQRQPRRPGSRLPPDSDGLRRTLPHLEQGRPGTRYAGTGPQASHLEHGPQNHHRLRHPVQ